VIAAIDKKKVIHYKQFKGYIDRYKFIEFLDELEKKMEK